MSAQRFPPQSSLATGLRSRCPQCGEGALFQSGFTLDIRPACPSCGLDYKFIDSGDGPAVFAIFILGAVVLGLALWVESVFAPPFWVHVALWTPATLGFALGLLRPLKAMLIAQQYKHKAGELRGRRD